MTKVRKAPEGAKRCRFYMEPNQRGYYNVLCAGSIIAPNVPNEIDALLFAASDRMVEALQECILEMPDKHESQVRATKMAQSALLLAGRTYHGGPKVGKDGKRQS